MWASYKDLHHGDFLRNLKIMKLDGVSSQEVYIYFWLKNSESLADLVEGNELLCGRLFSSKYVQCTL